MSKRARVVLTVMGLGLAAAIQVALAHALHAEDAEQAKEHLGAERLEQQGLKLQPGSHDVPAPV